MRSANNSHTNTLFAAWELFSAELSAAFSANHDDNDGNTHTVRAAFDTRDNRSKNGDPPMDSINFPNAVTPLSRQFFGTAALAIAASQLALTGSATAQSAVAPYPGNKKPAALAAP